MTHFTPAHLFMGLRLLKARLRHSTVRFKTRDLRALYARFDECEIPYVVLRWAAETPLTPAAEKDYSEDVDHLIGDDHLDQIWRLSGAQAGPVSCDYYSVSGQRGSAYHSMPYYMPSMASRVLARRERHANGIFVPCAEDALRTYLYHLTYHKGARCGIETGVGIPAAPQPKRDYAAEVTRLAALAGVELPRPYTLLGFHDYLRSLDWNMAVDLMPRWNERHAMLDALAKIETERAKPLIARSTDLTVFVMRSDCGGDRGEAIARSMISERFKILHEVRLSGALQERVTFQTRGGNWIEKGCDAPTLPTLAIICRNAPVPGPLPVDMSPAKLRRRYPHIVTTDVLIKRVVRDRVAELDGVSSRAKVLHATDNPLETVETLRAIYGAGVGDFLGSVEAGRVTNP